MKIMLNFQACQSIFRLPRLKFFLAIYLKSLTHCTCLVRLDYFEINFFLFYDICRFKVIYQILSFKAYTFTLGLLTHLLTDSLTHLPAESLGIPIDLFDRGFCVFFVAPYYRNFVYGRDLILSH